MKATSKAQQKAAGAALSAKRGETKPSELYDASKEKCSIKPTPVVGSARYHSPSATVNLF